MAAGGGGAWKVAYADFVTAMMAFFLVMWITAQSNSVKQAVSRYFEHPYDVSSRSAVPSKSSSGASLIPLHREMDGIAPKSTSKGKTTRGGGMLTDDAPPADPNTVPKTGGLRKRSGVLLRTSDDTGMGTIIQFAGDATALDEHAQQALNEVIPRLLGKLNKIEIRGHSVPSATASAATTSDQLLADSWQLSYARCLATMKYLEAHGVEAKRIRLSQAGNFEPPSDDNMAASSQTARVEIYMLGEYADDYLGRESTPVVDSEKEKEASAASE